MKPQGLLTVILENSSATPHVDDDYDWYIRHHVVERRAPLSRGPGRWASTADRLASLARYVRTRTRSQPHRLS